MVLCGRITPQLITELLFMTAIKLVISSDFVTITNYQLATFNCHVVLFRFSLQVF
jgi:hypothetical protein